MEKKNCYKTVFISDIHLWNPKNIANKLLGFLKSVTTEHLIICWDFIDFWQLRWFWKWTQKESKLLEYINQLSKSWVKVTYIQGNHDNKITCSKDIHLEWFSILRELFYTTWKNQKFYITHWDCFDWITSHCARFSQFCNRFYGLTLKLEELREEPQKTKQHISIVDKIEIFIERHRHNNRKILKQIFNLANQLNCDWIIMWHYHCPMHLARDKIEYYNTWDWLHTWSALVENLEGNLELLFLNEN